MNSDKLYHTYVNSESLLDIIKGRPLPVSVGTKGAIVWAPENPETYRLYESLKLLKHLVPVSSQLTDGSKLSSLSDSPVKRKNSIRSENIVHYFFISLPTSDLYFYEILFFKDNVNESESSTSSKADC